jgi:hypothetical protein
MRIESKAPATIVAIISAAACCNCARPVRHRSSYVTLREVERTYGPLLAAGNHPTPSQHGTGERVGLFRDASGTIWGLPLVVDSDGAFMACVPKALRSAEPTDRVDTSAAIIGVTNEPTGWRGGTGEMELLLRDPHGAVRRQFVHGADLPEEGACWSADTPGPADRLHYYRLAPLAAGVE